MSNRRHRWIAWAIAAALVAAISSTVGAPRAGTCEIWPPACSTDLPDCQQCLYEAENYKEWALCWCGYLKFLPSAYYRCLANAEQNYQDRITECYAPYCNG